MRKKKPAVKPRVRMFALDTNVLVHDPLCMYHFQEHDVFIPLEVLEELDNHKKGPAEISRSSREASRQFDAICNGDNSDVQKGLSLAAASHGKATGRIFFQSICKMCSVFNRACPGFVSQIFPAS